MSRDPDARYDGTDSTNTVRAFVDSTGAVVDFEVSRNWRRTLDPRQLGTAVRQAVQAAGMASVASWANRLGKPDDTPPVTVPRGTINPSPAVIQHALSLLTRMRSERNADPVTVPPVRARSAGGHITVTLVAGRLVAVEVASRWNAGNMEVASELRSAFEAAATTTGTPGVADELRTFAADPTTLLTTIFGIESKRGNHDTP